MRYAVTLLVLIPLAVVGCKPKPTGPDDDRRTGADDAGTCSPG